MLEFLLSNFGQTFVEFLVLLGAGGFIFGLIGGLTFGVWLSGPRSTAAVDAAIGGPPLWRIRGRDAASIGLALLLVWTLPLRVFAQEPAPSPSPAPVVETAPGPAETTAAAAAPATKARTWLGAVDLGPSRASTPEQLEPYASVRLTVLGTRDRVRVGGQVRADRTSNGSAFTMADFKLIKSAEALAFATVRVGDSPISLGAAGALSWSLESGVKSIRDPNLWSFGGIACVERFAWWPNGGLACIGAGRWSGKDGLRVSVTQPLKGEAVMLVVDTDVPFAKLPDFVRALPGAVGSAPLTGPPTPEQIRGIARHLPITVKVGVLVRLKGLEF